VTRGANGLARAISVVGHPFVTILLLVSVVAARRSGPAEAMQPVALIAIAILLPIGLFMYRKVRSGRWGTIDASNPRDRPALFRFGLVLIVVVGAFIAFSPRLRFLGRGIVAIVVLLAVAALVNRFVKASLHLAFAAYVAVILLRFAPAIGIGVLLFLPLLAWARVAMGRHSTAEIAAGAGIGTAVGALALVT